MIYIDDDSVKIGGIILPGIYKSIEVNHDAKIDEQDVEGSSVKPKQASGYDDARIMIEISLMDSETVTKEDKLQIIQNMFRGMGQDKPRVHEMVSAHSTIRGVKNVIIKNMTSKETNKKDEIVVNMELMQYETMTIQASGNSGKKIKKNVDDTAASDLTDSYQDYLASGRGITDSIIKSDEEAATESANTSVLTGNVGASTANVAAAGMAILESALKQQSKTEKTPAADME